MLKDGVIRTVRGAPVRPAHTWWGLAYDPDKRRLVFWDAHRGLMFSNRSAIATALDLDPKAQILRDSGSGPGEACVFTFYPQTREWKEVMSNAPKAYESSELEYLADRKTLWLHSGQTYVFDDKGKWKATAPAKAGPQSGGLTACDPRTHTIVSIRGETTYIYSTADDRWTRPSSMVRWAGMFRSARSASTPARRSLCSLPAILRSPATRRTTAVAL